MKIKINDFNLSATIDSGQVFGFNKHHGHIYEGAIAGTMMKLRTTKNALFININQGTVNADAIINYFDLTRDLSGLYQIFSSDKVLSGLLKLKGLRIIRQDPWDAMGSFIISSNNNIKRICGIWKNLAEKIGKNKIMFPTPAEIASSSENFLRRQGLGFRAEYLKKSAAMVAENPLLIEKINSSSYEEAKNLLMEFPGIGGKIADCVLLFGFQRTEAFPVDIWIQRIMSDLYFNKNRVSNPEILEFAKNKWGPWAGYVQQYLYHGARTGTI